MNKLPEEWKEEMNEEKEAKTSSSTSEPDIWKWRTLRNGEAYIEGVDVVKAKNWLLQNNQFITTGEKIFTIHYYSDGFYKKGGEKYIQDLMQKATKGKHLTTQNLREIIAHIQRETFADNNILTFTKKELVCVKNGILNLNTRQLIAHSPKYYFFQQVPLKYNPDADCPNITKVIYEILGLKSSIIFKEFLGHLLLRNYSYKKAFILVGEKDTGKSTLLKLIVAFIGEENTSNESIHRLIKDKFATINLRDKLLNFYDDLSAEDINDAGTLKIITGNGWLSGEYKFGERLKFQNYAKLIFACNKIIGLKDKDMDDDAYYGRWIIFFCENIFDSKNQDKQLIEKLITDKELSGLLNWALDGLKQLELQGSFSYDKTPEQVKDIILKGSNSISAFVQDCLIKDSDGWISKEDMFQAYSAYVEAEGLGRVTKEKFGRDLQVLAKFIIEARKDTEKKKSVTGWKGVKLNNENHTSKKVIFNYNSLTQYNDENSVISVIQTGKSKDSIILFNSESNNIPSKSPDAILLPCHKCGAPPPCYYLDNKTQRQLCELCAKDGLGYTEETIGQGDDA